MKLIRIVIPLVVLLAGGPAFGQTVQTKWVFSAGGARITGGIYELNGNLGDVISGISMTPGGSQIIEHGFWAGNIYQLLDVNDEPRVTFVEFLGPAAPNPALRSTTLEFGLPKADRVTLRIYDVTGRLVRELINLHMHSGVFRMSWDLRSKNEDRVQAGIYFVRFTTSTRSHVQRVVVVE